MKTIFSTLTWEHHQNGTAAPLKWDRTVPAAIINNYRVNDQISFKIPLEFMKEKVAAIPAAVPFQRCTLLELITSITMSPSLQMNMNCHVHVLLSECMLALLASAWNVHRPERSHCDTEGEVNVKVIQGQTSLMKWISLKRETGSLRKLCKWWTTMFREERDLQEIIAFVNVTTC